MKIDLMIFGRLEGIIPNKLETINIKSENEMTLWTISVPKGIRGRISNEISAECLLVVSVLHIALIPKSRSRGMDEYSLNKYA